MSEKILTLQNEGNSLAPRDTIMNDRGHYLNERDNSWGSKFNATLYGCPNDGSIKVKELLLKQFGALPSRRFVAPLFVEIHTAENVTATEVQEWLHSIVRIATDCRRHGLGPVAENLGLITVDWSKLQEVSL